MKLKIYILLFLPLLLINGCKKDSTLNKQFPAGEVVQLKVDSTLFTGIGIPYDGSSALYVDGFNNPAYAENLLLVRLYTDNTNHIWSYFITQNTTNTTSQSKIEIAVDANGYAHNLAAQTQIDSTLKFSTVTNTQFVNLVSYALYSRSTPVNSPWVTQLQTNSAVQGYVGYRVTNKYGVFYGWMNLIFTTTDSGSGVQVTIGNLTRYDVPDQSIKAGQNP